MNAAKTRSSLFIRKLTYSALCLALAIVLPFLTGQIPQIGSMLCPMHIPALLCGFLCGWQYGAVLFPRFSECSCSVCLRFMSL